MLEAQPGGAPADQRQRRPKSQSGVPSVAGTAKVLFVPVTAGKETRMGQFPECNRNGRRKPLLATADYFALHWEHGYRCHGPLDRSTCAWAFVASVLAISGRRVTGIPCSSTRHGRTEPSPRSAPPKARVEEAGCADTDRAAPGEGVGASA